MSQQIIHGFDGLRALVGVDLPPTAWLAVDQARIDAFAACTGDAQWIHVDVERARTGEYGATIAHGYLVLALIAPLWQEHFDVRGVGPVINYGLDRVRFPAPVKAGSRIRARFITTQATDVNGGLLVKKRVTLEAEGSAKPVCVADTLVLYRSGGVEAANS
ncbi:MAG TPA: MaoC family dehydratase [Candidatus Dormibacteraeota bacterium]|nr:MaoC family dehydratase [Candidatus Dormibacteraeota bacterium]